MRRFSVHKLYTISVVIVFQRSVGVARSCKFQDLLMDTVESFRNE